MKIGHYVPGIWENGGVASYIRRIGESQVNLGHDVVYLDIHAPGPDVSAALRTATVAIGLTSQLFPIAKSLGLDILHVHTVLPPSAVVTVPTMRTVHGHQPYCPSGSRFLQRSNLPCNNAYNLLGCTANHFTQRCGSIRPNKIWPEFSRTWREMLTLKSIPIIAVSNFIKQQMVRSGYAESTISVLYLPAPPVKNVVSPPQDGVPHFLFLGRLSATKGVAWLLNAVAVSRTPLCLDIAGTGDEEATLRALTQQLGLSDKVTFHGWVSEADVFRLLANARALVFPSLWHEPAGIVALEAMANGRAIIVSRVGGAPEVVEEGVNGLLVDPGNVRQLAGAIDRLAADLQQAIDLGQEGRKMVLSSFTLDSHVEHLMEHYARCIELFPRAVMTRAPEGRSLDAVEK
jgi:glycosyltransferase involved in cell wall biosynthesis